MMMMKWARILLSSIAWVVCSCGPRFCRAQGNSSPSSNPCETSEKCGAYGVCSPWGSPICTCLPGFEPRNNLEWGSQNWSGGCERRLPLRCEGDNGTTDDGFVKLQATMISLTDRWLGPENECQGRCLRNCSCLAYSFADSSRGCRFWGGPLIDIQKFPGDSGSYVNIRLSSSELGNFTSTFTLYHFPTELISYYCLQIERKALRKS